MIGNAELGIDVLKREVETEGVKFVLTAHRLASGWFGEWICCGCGQRGVNGVVYATPVLAIDVTARNLTGHACRPHK
jgi:hypothetical protein